MAYAAIVSFSQILEQVTDDDQQQIKPLREKLCLLQSFLEDCYNYNGEKLDPLEKRIRDTVYEAEDVVELHILNQVASEGSLVSKYEQMPYLGMTYQNDLKRLNEKINSIVEEAMKIKRSSENETLIPRGVGSSSIQAPIICRNTVVVVVGLHDDDLQKMKARLCRDSSKLEIIPIVGMGGIGKTTLAKTIFDDSLIAECFNFRAWVTISQEYCIRDILLGLLNSLGALTNDLSAKGDEVLAQGVYQTLKGRRYLVVMDDMWSTKAWDDTRRLLPDDNNGSRIIITSRLSEVGRYADPSSPLHHMQLLNVDQSWSLLRQNIFEREPCPLELQEIGKTIAGKCGGLPLAIVLVAGILSQVHEKLNNWEEFAANVSSALQTDDEPLFNIFSLSYNNLPHPLRACFLYMGGFPEDHEIRISKLAMLWTAEGFLKPITSKSSEEAAEDYVGDLVKRNLISIAKKKANGRFKSCRIHDLLRDFSIRKAHDENFLYVKKDSYASQEVIFNKRRLCDFTNSYIPTTRSDTSIRSLLFSHSNHEYLTSLTISSKLLRVLDGRSTCLDYFPSEITELTHLRYLAFLHDPDVQCVVPASILNLRHLQTLIIESYYKFTVPRYFLSHNTTVLLPPEIWEMPKLRHLVIDNGCLLPVPFSTISDGKVHSLNNLYTLYTVADFCFAKETIEMIPNLKKLGIIYFGDEESPVLELFKYQLSNLIHLRQLETLVIVCKTRQYLLPLVVTNFSRSFALPLKLKKLDLFGGRLSSRNLETIGQLRNLEVLKLRRCDFVDKDWKMNEGEFVQLKYLLMHGVDIKCWHVESAELCNLEELVISGCSNLQEIPCEIGEIPALEYIGVIDGLDSLRASAIQIQEEQLSYGNDSLQVHVRPLPAGVSP